MPHITTLNRDVMAKLAFILAVLAEVNSDRSLFPTSITKKYKIVRSMHIQRSIRIITSCAEITAILYRHTRHI